MVDVEEDGNFIFLIDAHKVLHDLLCGDGVERGDRLIGKDDLRVLVQSARKRDTLLLAAGELVAAGVGLVKNADLIKAFERVHFLLLGEDAEEHLEEGHIGHVGSQHVLDGGAARDEVEALEDHADLAAVAAKLLAAQGVDLNAVNGELTLGDIVHTVDAAQDRGLARTGQADDRNKFTLLDLKIDVLQRGEAVGIGLVNILEFYHAATLFSFNMDFSSY